jgi:hypothetical protein
MDYQNFITNINRQKIQKKSQTKQNQKMRRRLKKRQQISIGDLSRGVRPRPNNLTQIETSKLEQHFFNKFFKFFKFKEKQNNPEQRKQAISRPQSEVQHGLQRSKIDPIVSSSAAKE